MVKLWGKPCEHENVYVLWPPDWFVRGLPEVCCHMAVMKRAFLWSWVRLGGE